MVPAELSKLQEATVPNLTTQWVISLFGSVFRLDQKLRPNCSTVVSVPSSD